MKKKVSNILSVIIGACAILSCSEDANRADLEIRKSSDINVAYADTSFVSRVVVDNYGKDSKGESFSWENGDEIGIAFGANAAFKSFQAIGVKNGVAVFHRDEGIVDSVYGVTYSIYPMSSASNVTVNENSISYTAKVNSQTQIGKTTDHIGDNLCMYAIEKNVNWFEQSWFSGKALEFKHLCGMIRYRIKNESSFDLGINNISMTINEGGVFYTTENVTLKADGTASITSGNTTQVMSLTCSGCTVKSGENWDGYMVVLPSAGANGITVKSSITVESYTDEVTFFKSGRTTKYSLPQIVAGQTYYVSLTASDGILPESVRDTEAPALNFEIESIEEY